jgi:threonine synthase
MRFVSSRGAHGAGQPAAVSFKTALFEGLAPDGGLYVPERIDRWTDEQVSALASRSLADVAIDVLGPFVCDDIDAATLRSIVDEALNFPIVVAGIEPGIHALELFHGPTLAFKDVGARVMARLMASMHDGGAPLTVLVATSGDTGGAVAHAFHGVPHTRVVILYPDRRISPTQEAQLTMFNGESTNVRAYAVAGSFDDCQRLVKEAFGNPALRRAVRLTSANSINVGRLLPQMVYYAHAVAELARATGSKMAGSPVVSTPSGNFGNLTAGLMMKRAGAPIARFVAATNVNDIVPRYLNTGRFEPRPSIPTLSNAMDVGNPSNFDRIMWLYGHDVDAVRRDVVGSRHDDDEVRATIRRVSEDRGYVLDPHSAVAYLGLKCAASDGKLGLEGPGFAERAPGIFVATAHPAKFGEIVEPIIGRAIPTPPSLADALSRGRQVVRIQATLDAVTDVVME